MRKGLSNEDRSLRLYLNDITTSKPLSREREVELAARIQQGDLQARDELVQANLRFVIDVAKRFQNRGLPLCELVSAGNLGLITAAESFDGTKGFKFITYAVRWIRHYLLKAIAQQTRMVRLPVNRLALLAGIAKASERLGQACESLPDVEAIAAELEVSAKTVLNTLTSARTVYSLDKTFGEEGERNLLSTLADPRQESPEARVLSDSARKQLQDALNNLDERELRVLRLYFGLDGYKMLTLEQIGDLFRLTRPRVGQLKEQALGKLRRLAHYPALLELASDMEGT